MRRAWSAVGGYRQRCRRGAAGLHDLRRAPFAAASALERAGSALARLAADLVRSWGPPEMEAAERARLA